MTPTLKELLRMSQEGILEKALALPGAMTLTGNNPGEISVFVQGTVPFVLVAHMDTVYGGVPKTIIHERSRITVPKGSGNGIGGDDRCGCWTLFQAASWEYSPSLLFCMDEESVGHGSSPGLDEYDWSDQKCFVEVDGPGYGVYYAGQTSNATLNAFMEDELGLTKEYTSYNDISEICKPGNPPGVTLGAAYYNQHNANNEWISEFGLGVQLEVIKQMVKSIDRLDWSVVSQVTYSSTGYVPSYKGYSSHSNSTKKAEATKQEDLTVLVASNGDEYLCTGYCDTCQCMEECWGEWGALDAAVTTK